MQRVFVPLMFYCLVGCGTSAEDIVISTTHCGGTLLNPELLMRLSSYQPKTDSTPMWIVQACHPKGGCEPVLTYRQAMPPIYSLRSDGSLRIELLGGSISEVHREEIKVGGFMRQVFVEHYVGEESRNLMPSFRARLGLPPGTGFSLACDRALDVRPSVRG